MPADMQIVEAIRKGVESAPSSVVYNERAHLLEVFKALDEARAAAKPAVVTPQEDE